MATLTKKHFKDIAEIFNDLSTAYLAPGPSLIKTDWFHAITVIDIFCDLLSESNPKFNRYKFIEACGYEPWDELINGVPFKE